jgi:hypothetical protein
MDLVQYSGDCTLSGRYCWGIWLRKPEGEAPVLVPEQMTASEQMFFLGSPLAQVVEYQKFLRSQRHRAVVMGAARLTRVSTPASLASVPVRARQPVEA